MAKRVLGYVPGVEREYVPEALGNRLDVDPVTVWIKNPTERDRYALTCLGEVFKIEKSDTSKYSIDMAEIHNRHCAAVERCVSRVANYTNAAGGPILTGEDLATHGDQEIVAEVGQEILSNLSLKDEQRKKPNGSSASTSAATQAQPGTAKSAKPEVSIDFATVAASPAVDHTLPSTVSSSTGVRKHG